MPAKRCEGFMSLSHLRAAGARSITKRRKAKSSTSAAMTPMAAPMMIWNMLMGAPCPDGILRPPRKLSREHGHALLGQKRGLQHAKRALPDAHAINQRLAPYARACAAPGGFAMIQSAC